VAVVIKTGLCIVFATVFGWGLNGALGGVLAAMVCVWVAGARAILADASGGDASEQVLPPFAVRLIPALIAGNVAFVAMTQLDIVLVNHYFEPELSSQYTAAAILGKAVLYLPAGLAMAIYPMVVEDRARGQGSRGLATQAVTATLVLCGSAALAYRVAGSWIAGFLFGEAYAQAGRLLAMYGLAMVPMGVAILLNHFLVAAGRTLLAWLFVAAALVEVGVIHVWHPGLESVIAVIAICNLLLATAGCFLLASFSDASHTQSSGET
jgi:O-antigen/teichoic acid export membrane protein